MAESGIARHKRDRPVCWKMPCTRKRDLPIRATRKHLPRRLSGLEKLLGTWKLTGDVSGEIPYEWAEGGFFLIQHVDLIYFGRRNALCTSLRGMSEVPYAIPDRVQPLPEWSLVSSRWQDDQIKRYLVSKIIRSLWLGRRAPQIRNSSRLQRTSVRSSWESGFVEHF